MFIRILSADTTTWTFHLTPASPSLVIPITPDPFRAAATYLRLGNRVHLLVGIDHLLLVLGLMLILHDRWMLLKTITSFTVARRITFLAVATLGYMDAALPPAECCYCSLHSLPWSRNRPPAARQDQLDAPASVACGGPPWVAARIGFPSGLTALGLSRAEIPEALMLDVGRRAGTGLLRVANHSARTKLPHTPNPLAAFGGSAAILHRWWTSRVLDHRTNRNADRRTSMKRVRFSPSGCELVAD